MRIGYLTGEYPAPTHTFIMSEVAALRGRGVEVRTYSVHRAPADRLLSPRDRAAAAETRSIQPPDARQVARAHLRAVTRHPVRYARTLALALRLSPGGVRAGLWHLFYFAEAILLWSWTREDGVTHLHAHFANASSMICLLAADFGAIGWSFTMHGPTEFDDVTRYRVAEKIGHARFVACISDYCRAQLMKLVGREEWDKLHVVRCGIDFTRLDAPTPPPEPDTPLRVLTVGRLVPDKGQTQLVEAVARLGERGVAVETEVVGDGPERGVLEREARERGLDGTLRLAGAISQDAMPDRFRHAHVFCLPSFAEGVPVSIMEAMALERPVVTTRIMGIPELVVDGLTGRLVAPGRPDELADALAELAADPAARQSMGRAGRERVRGLHDIETSAAQLGDLFARAA